MEATKKSPLGIALKFGIILGLINSVLSLLFFILDMPDSKIPQYLGLAVGIGTIVLGIQTHRDKELDGQLSYGRGVGTGVLISLFGAIIAAVYTFIYIKFIDIGMAERLMAKEEQEMLNRGLADKDIEVALNYMKMFMTSGAITSMVVVMGTLWGAIVSLVASAFLKKNHVK